MRSLPRLMVAPTGARRGKFDHPALPITEDEIVETAHACQKAGADGIHLHIRDESGAHLLDADRYHALLDRLGAEVPGLYLQVTSEAAGRYGPDEQRAMMRRLKPANVSVGLREMVRGSEDWPAARDFYHWAQDNEVGIQHILYSPQDVSLFADACANDLIPGPRHSILFVQGCYAHGARHSIDLEEYLAPLEPVAEAEIDWMVCAFGEDETASLVRAAELGGKARVGFENSMWHADGSLARDNAARVREVDAALRGLARSA